MEWYKVVHSIKGMQHDNSVAVSYWINERLKYIITFSKTKEMYYLCEVNEENKVVKTKEKSRLPTDLEKKINLKGCD